MNDPLIIFHSLPQLANTPDIPVPLVVKMRYITQKSMKGPRSAAATNPPAPVPFPPLQSLVPSATR